MFQIFIDLCQQHLKNYLTGSPADLELNFKEFSSPRKSQEILIETSKFQYNVGNNNLRGPILRGNDLQKSGEMKSLKAGHPVRVQLKKTGCFFIFRKSTPIKFSHLNFKKKIILKQQRKINYKLLKLFNFFYKFVR